MARVRVRKHLGKSEVGFEKHGYAVGVMVMHGTSEVGFEKHG